MTPYIIVCFAVSAFAYTCVWQIATRDYIDIVGLVCSLIMGTGYLFTAVYCLRMEHRKVDTE